MHNRRETRSFQAKTIDARRLCKGKAAEQEKWSFRQPRTRAYPDSCYQMSETFKTRSAYPRVPGQLSHNGGIHPKQRHSRNDVIPATRSFALTPSFPQERRQSGKGNRAWRYSFWKWEKARRISRNIRWIEHGNPGCRDLYGAICAQTGFPPFAGMKMYIFTGMTLSGSRE